nr:hypothetical protein [Tanacetum cinerariifolium]
MLHIFPRVHGQSFAELPFEEEILAFIRFLGHNAAIRRLTDVNINKLYQPWISFATIINKCLTGKSFGYDSLRLSQAQIMWGLYHKRNVNHAYLMWEDFVYQVEHKISKKSNEMYYPRFTKVIIHHFMSKDPSIPRRNKNTQQLGALLPIELTNEEIKNYNAYKEYYEIATGAAPPKPKASVRRTRSSSDTSITPPTAAEGPRLTTSAKGKQVAKASKAKSLPALSEVAMIEAQQLKLVTKRSLQQTHISQRSGSGTDEGTGSIPGVLDVPTKEFEEELSWNSTNDEGDDDGKDGDGDDDDNAKASKAKSIYALSEVAMTKVQQLKLATKKSLQQTHISQASGSGADEGTGDDVDDDEQDVDEAQDDEDQEDEGNDEDDEKEGSDDEQASDQEEFIHPSLSTHAKEETRDEESFDPIPKTPENTNDEGNGEENLGKNVGRKEGQDEEDKADEL